MADLARAESGGFDVRESALREYCVVRGALLDLAVLIERLWAIVLPGTPNTVAAGLSYRALWLAPDEWLFVSHEPTTPRLETVLRPLLGGAFASVVDVSSGYTMFEITGPRAREVLQKGCPLDLHPRALPIGMCAQSHFFKAGIIVRPVADDAFEVVVRRSYADYAMHMLRDAASLSLRGTH